jgi:hypothetical protein
MGRSYGLTSERASGFAFCCAAAGKGWIGGGWMMWDYAVSLAGLLALPIAANACAVRGPERNGRHSIRRREPQNRRVNIFVL